MQEFTRRITADNAADLIKEGDVIVGAEEMGQVRAVRPTYHDPHKAITITTMRPDGTRDQDVFGVPQTLTLQRD